MYRHMDVHCVDVSFRLVAFRQDACCGFCVLWKTGRYNLQE